MKILRSFLDTDDCLCDKRLSSAINVKPFQPRYLEDGPRDDYVTASDHEVIVIVVRHFRPHQTIFQIQFRLRHFSAVKDSNF